MADQSTVRKRGWVQSSPVNFKPKWINKYDVRHMMLTHGKVRPRHEPETAEQRSALREACNALAWRPCAHGETVVLKGSKIKNKGGVMPRSMMD